MIGYPIIIGRNTCNHVKSIASNIFATAKIIVITSKTPIFILLFGIEIIYNFKTVFVMVNIIPYYLLFVKYFFSNSYQSRMVSTSQQYLSSNG